MLDRIFIHIGPPKTGSTTIQSALFNNIEKLRASGTYSPFQK